MAEKNLKDATNKLVCFRFGVLLQDWITFKALALEDKSWIMNQIAEEKYGHLCSQLINSCSTSEILKDVLTLILDKAILEPTFCPMYAKLCFDVHKKLPTFPPTEPVAKEITFLRVLLNLCQCVFGEAKKLREELRSTSAPDQKEKVRFVLLKTLGNLRFIGELIKHKMVPIKSAHSFVQKLLEDDETMCPSEEIVEFVCLFLKTIGKELDVSSLDKRITNGYFKRLKNLSNDSRLVIRVRCLIRSIIYLRSNHWVSKPEVTKYY